jgi:TIR domain
MAVTVIAEVADERGHTERCVLFPGLPIDASCRITVMSVMPRLRQDLFAGLCRALDRYATRGECSPRDPRGVNRLAVVATDGTLLPAPALGAAVETFLAQPRATAVGVLPLRAPMTSLPPSAARFEVARYRSDVCDAVDDVLAAAGVDPAERRAFISYSRRDRREALELEEALADERFQTYLDTRINPPASPWDQVLRDALVDAELVVVLETAQSAASNWVKREIGVARARGAGVIAVQPGPPFPFRYIGVRFVGPARNAGPFVAEQHRLLLTAQRESRLESVVAELSNAGVRPSRVGGSVRAAGRLIGVYPQPVTLRQLRRTVSTARARALAPVTYSPQPVLAAKRDDRRWMHHESDSVALSDGSLWRLTSGPGQS